jgi:membrane associated rhomboid family serine protease
MLFPVRVEVEVDDTGVGSGIEKLALFTYLLIVANALVFCSIHFFPLAMREMAYYDYGFVAERIELFPLVGHMFVHVGWLHILGNMYYLWLFGRAAEMRMGRPVFALLYFTSGVAGALLQGALTPAYLADVPAIGASGAIAGVLGAFMILYPREKVTCFYFMGFRYMTTISISSVWILGAWLIFQFANALWFSAGADENSVAYFAHIGGFVFGAGAAAVVKYFADIATMLRRRSAKLELEECSDMLHEGKADQARAKLKAALEKRPGDALTLAEIGRLRLADGDRSAARKMFRRSLKAGLKQKNAAAAVAAYYGLVAAKARPVDNSLRLVIGRRFANMRKYGHALGVLAEPFRPGAEVEGLDKLLYEIGDLLAGPLKDPLRASAAFSLLAQLFPHSPRALDVKYRLRRFRAVGRN